MTKAEGEHVENMIKAASQALVGSFIAGMLHEKIDVEQVERIAQWALKDSGCPIEIKSLSVMRKL